MINFRRKIGIILVGAVSAAAILAIPASAAPKRDTEPAPFEHGCQGTVAPQPTVRVIETPSSNYSCNRFFTLSSTRTALMELRPHSNFTGTMEAELSSGNGVLVKITGTWVGGEVQVSQEIATPTLSAGTWRLAVRAKAQTFVFNWLPGSYVAVYTPLSSGGFGARVSSL